MGNSFEADRVTWTSALTVMPYDARDDNTASSWCLIQESVAVEVELVRLILRSRASSAQLAEELTWCPDGADKDDVAGTDVTRPRAPCKIEEDRKRKGHARAASDNDERVVRGHAGATAIWTINGGRKQLCLGWEILVVVSLVLAVLKERQRVGRLEAAPALFNGVVIALLAVFLYDSLVKLPRQSLSHTRKEDDDRILVVAGLGQGDNGEWMRLPGRHGVETDKDMLSWRPSEWRPDGDADHGVALVGAGMYLDGGPRRNKVPAGHDGSSPSNQGRKTPEANSSPQPQPRVELVSRVRKVEADKENYGDEVLHHEEFVAPRSKHIRR